MINAWLHFTDQNIVTVSDGKVEEEGRKYYTIKIMKENEFCEELIMFFSLEQLKSFNNSISEFLDTLEDTNE